MNRRTIALIACISSLSWGPVALYGCNAIPGVSQQAVEVALSQSELRQIAKSITVKVWAGDARGSGTLIMKESGRYTVLTNDHVIAVGSPDRIETNDGKIYPTTAVEKVDFQGKDLALLQFNSEADYPIASLGHNERLFPKQQVLAAGFPYQQEELVFSEGSLTLLSDKAFEGGYRIGYSNDIQKGMSGGPVLNGAGKVIAINGMHAYPFFDPYIYEDGTRPEDKREREIIRSSSWGVPMATFAELAPDFMPSTLVEDVRDMAEQITVRIDLPSGNGSGVIIGKKWNTYYVLTAEHVVRDEGKYEVVTHDRSQF